MPDPTVSIRVTARVGRAARALRTVRRRIRRLERRIHAPDRRMHQQYRTRQIARRKRNRRG